MAHARERPPLVARIAEAVEKDGPLTIERYWNIALYDRDFGYYATHEPFGTAGDFTTAPEISQMFGELLGAWMIATWEALGRPSPFTLAEMGPGRGTLMADMLRAIRSLCPALLSAARLTLVETSERLSIVQSETLASLDLPIRRARRLEEAAGLPLLVVSNELFDAVAIRQFAYADRTWRERLVGLGSDGGLCFTLSEPVASGELPLAYLTPPGEGAVLEISPMREAIAATMGRLVADRGGAALAIDYGHLRSGYGDTLQAMKGHAYVDPLAEPGWADITSHVDFARLARIFSHSGLSTGVMEQGDFLLSLGLVERAGALGRGRRENEQAGIRAAVQRLAGNGDDQMGRLFKVIGAATAPLPLPPFGAVGGAVA